MVDRFFIHRWNATSNLELRIYSYKIHVDVYAKMNYVDITKI